MEHESNVALDPELHIAELGTRLEGQWFERKSGRVDIKGVAEALVAFANADGGTIFVGYHDGELDPVPRSRVNDLRQVMFTRTSPPVRSRVQEIPVPGKPDAVCVVYTVEPGEKVHETSNGDSFLRVGDSTHKLNYAQRKELQFDRGSPPFDGTPSQADAADLDADQVDGYCEAIGASSKRSMLNARNLLTREGELTVAGALLFSSHPQSQFPNAHVRVMRYTDTDRGTGARLALVDGGDIRVEGSLPEQITNAAEVIENWIPKRTALAGTGRFEPVSIVPRDAWLEGLVNAVVHRSYSLYGDHIRVEIFPDRIEVTSPGRFPGLVDTRRPLDISRHARNPRIARVLGELRIARDMGEGIKRIFEEMRRRSLTDPIYEQAQASVRLVLSAQDAVPDKIRDELSKSARVVLDVMRREATPLGTGQVAQVADIAKPTAIRALRSLQGLGLIVWEGESPKDPRATWRLA